MPKAGEDRTAGRSVLRILDRKPQNLFALHVVTKATTRGPEQTETFGDTLPRALRKHLPFRRSPIDRQGHRPTTQQLRHSAPVPLFGSLLSSIDVIQIDG